LAVLDDQGRKVLDNQQDSRKLFSEKTINYINLCMTDAVSVGYGTAANLFKDLGIATAGKTGTTQDDKDRYFCGFTGYYTAAVWCGFDTPEEIYMSSDVPEERTNPSCQLWKKVMLQLHAGLENIPLYDTSKMEQVTICYESGLLATDACARDIRTNRTFQEYLYPEDVPTQFCDHHVDVDYCVNGVAGEYCQKFQSVGLLNFQKKALVKMTQEWIDKLMMANGKDLYPSYTTNNYVYLVDEKGNPQPFFGMDPRYPINEGLEVPYEVCTEHTKEAWEQYVKDHPWLDDSPDEPEEPVDPEGPLDPNDPALPPEQNENENTED
jgi:membrane peptidoglycan carboxypeptidase